MENRNDTTRPGTPPEPAADGLRANTSPTLPSAADLFARCDAESAAYETRLAALEAEVAEMPLERLAGLLHQAGEQLDEAARDCCDDDCRWSYLAEASAVWRAAHLIRRLANLEVKASDVEGGSL